MPTADASAAAPLRLFCALRLPPDTVTELAAWQQSVLGAAVGAGRIVPPENLHLTLAFLGSTARSAVPAAAAALRAVAARSGAIAFTLHDYHETRSVAMLRLRDESGAAGALASALAGELERLGLYRPERRPWTPHLTVLRFRDRPRLRPPVPDLGRFSPSDAAVYSSLLRREGARYEVVEAMRLGG